MADKDIRSRVAHILYEVSPIKPARAFLIGSTWPCSNGTAVVARRMKTIDRSERRIVTSHVI
jgi:hypothetical protein